MTELDVWWFDKCIGHRTWDMGYWTSLGALLAPHLLCPDAEAHGSLSAGTAGYTASTASASTSGVGDVCLVEDRDAFLRLGPEWNALVERTRNEPFYRHEYIRSWIENFSPDAPLRILAARTPGGRLVAVLPLIEQRLRLFGVSTVQWTSPTDVHSYRFDVIAEDDRAAGCAFFERLRMEKGWDVLRITDVPPGGCAWRLFDRARGAGFPAGVYESQRSTYIALPASFEELRTALGGKFRGNLRRRRKLLEQKGKVTLERVTGGPDLQTRLEECFVIEQSGWKGTRGEPAKLHPAIHGFYSALAGRTSREGSFVLYLLKLDGRTIAFHYGLIQDGVYSLVMTSYDESLRECSPGHLLVEEVLRLCIQAGLREFDFLGCDLEWKRAWSPRSRPHSWLFVFRKNIRGRVVHNMKFRLGPFARRALAAWRGRTGSRTGI